MRFLVGGVGGESPAAAGQQHEYPAEPDRHDAAGEACRGTAQQIPHGHSPDLRAGLGRIAEWLRAHLGRRGRIGSDVEFGCRVGHSAEPLIGGGAGPEAGVGGGQVGWGAAVELIAGCCDSDGAVGFDDDDDAVLTGFGGDAPGQQGPVSAGFVAAVHVGGHDAQGHGCVLDDVVHGGAGCRRR